MNAGGKTLDALAEERVLIASTADFIKENAPYLRS
jgi:hypothetical protein